MSIEQLTCEALKLGSRDRAVLAETIWASLEDPYTLPLDLSDKEALQLAKKRDAELENGTQQPLTHSELMEGLRR